MPTSTSLIIKEALLRSATWLKEKGCEAARLDAELLLAHVLGLNRLGLYLNWDRPLAADEMDRYRDLLKRRAQHEPVAYIIGQKEFFGLAFRVSPAVLIPRPETELLVERAIALAREADRADPRAADVGVGSGAIAVTLAREWPQGRVIATDPSAAALEVARANAETHGVADRIEFRDSAFLDGVAGEVDLVVSNPPYVARRDRAALPPDVGLFEPACALFGGEDGLDVIRGLIPRAAEKTRLGGWLVMEMGAGQADAVRQLIAADGRYEPAETIRDHQGIERVVSARRV